MYDELQRLETCQTGTMGSWPLMNVCQSISLTAQLSVRLPAQVMQITSGQRSVEQVGRLLHVQWASCQKLNTVPLLQQPKHTQVETCACNCMILITVTAASLSLLPPTGKENPAGTSNIEETCNP